MKALVLELEDGRIAALREDGEIVTARREWPVGETIELDETDLEQEDRLLRLPARKRRWSQIAVAAALALVVLTGSYTYTTAWACSYVSLDVEDASVELAVNRLGRVIEVKALNEDSEDLAQALTRELRHKPVEEALEQAVERFQEEGRMAADETVVAGITDSSERRAAQLTEKLEQALGGPEDLRAVEVTPEQREEAREREMGGGRLVWEQQAPERTAPAQTAPAETPPPEEKTDSAAAAPAPEKPEAEKSGEQAVPARPETDAEPPVPGEEPPENAAAPAAPQVPEQRKPAENGAAAAEGQPRQEVPQQEAPRQPDAAPPAEGAPEQAPGQPGGSRGTETRPQGGPDVGPPQPEGQQR